MKLYNLILLIAITGCSVTVQNQAPLDVNQPTNQFAANNYSNDEVPASPKPPWGEFEIIKEEEPSSLRRALLWLPNRVLDFIDIFRVDAGIGFGAGVVVRATSYAQAGARVQLPSMLRIGLFGRDMPVKIEMETELGVGPVFKASSQRNLCKGVIAGGIDLFLVGLHLGVCPEELADFFVGITAEDFMDDDLK